MAGKADKISLLADWLERQMGEPSITDGRIMEEMGVSNGAFYRMKPKALQIATERAQKRQSIIEEAKTQETVDAALKGLKTKNERVLILQQQVDNCIEELDAGINPLTQKALDPYERVALRKSIRDLQAEVSKIEGDYAPEKREHSLEKGFFDFLKESSVS